MKLIAVFLLCALAVVNGQSIGGLFSYPEPKVVTNVSSTEEVEKIHLFKKWFELFTTKTGEFMSKAKEYLDDMEVEKTTKEYMGKAKEFVDETVKKLKPHKDLMKKQLDIFQEKMDEGKKIADEIRKQAEEYFKKLQDAVKTMKGQYPQYLETLKRMYDAMELRVQGLQTEMSDLQAKYNKAYQDGQEKMLTNIETQLELVREQLKDAKAQAETFKKQILDKVEELKTTATEMQGKAEQKVEDLKETVKDTISKVMEQYEIAQKAGKEHIEKIKVTVTMTKELITKYGEIMKEQAFETKENMTEYFSNMKKFLKTKADEYTQKATEMKVTVDGKMEEVKKQMSGKMDTVIEKGKEIKTEVQKKIQEKSMEMKEKIDKFMEQYESAIAKAVKMQKKAEEDLFRVLKTLQNGTLNLFDMKSAKDMVVENMKTVQEYFLDMQKFYTDQIKKFILKKRDTFVNTVPKKPSRLLAEKQRYLRLRKKLASIVPDNL